MKRRTFISLAGFIATLGLPLPGKAAKSNSPTRLAASTAVSPALEKCDRRAVIKVIGVGGTGKRTVEQMIRHGVQNMDFVCLDAESPALNPDHSSSRIPMFLHGLTGVLVESETTIGKEWASSKRVRIAETLKGAHLVFVTAGMGGGTGTGAAPVISAVAHEMGIPAVAVVTTPFSFEGRRVRRAHEGLLDLVPCVDALIVVSNEALVKVTGGDVTFSDIFRCADDVMKNVIVDIAENINGQGRVTIDFDDARIVRGAIRKAITDPGTGFGIGGGEDKEGNDITLALAEVIEIRKLTSPKTGVSP